MHEADFRKGKQFNINAAHRQYGVLERRTPPGWFAHWLWAMVLPLILLASCAPPAQNTVVPTVNSPSSGIATSPAPLPTNTLAPIVKPSATLAPPPATAAATNTVATSVQNLKTDAIKFSGDVQFPEALEKMRQDILYLTGVTDVQVGYGEVDVTYNPDQITLKQIEVVIEDHGYHVQE
jgi:copper chaperone CopZ